MKNCLTLMVAVGLFLFVTTVAHADLFMSVSGKVVAADDGAPLSGVTLRLLSPEKGKITEAKSNAQGVFIIRDVWKGDYSIWAVSDDPFIVSSNTNVPVTVPDGKNVVGIGIKLQRGGVIKGKVVTSNGKIVANANILGTGLPATTDTAGNFLLKGVAPGLIDLAVVASSLAAKEFSATCESGKVIDVGNVVLPVGASSAIRGTVVDTAGNPVSSVILAAANVNVSGAYAKSSNAGSFIITGLSAAKFKLTVVKYGYEPLTIADVPVPSSNLRVMLTPSPVAPTGVVQYKIDNDKSAVERMYLDNIIPASFLDSFSNYEDLPGEDGSCPDDGEWIGVSIDLTAGINLKRVKLSAGGSWSVGGLACLSRKVEFGFSQNCKYGGPGKEDFFGLSYGVSDILVSNACHAKQVLGSSNGVVIGGSSGIPASKFAISSGFAIDWSGPAYSLTISGALGIPTIGKQKTMTVPTACKIFGLNSCVGVARQCETTILRAGLEDEILDLGI